VLNSTVISLTFPWNTYGWRSATIGWIVAQPGAYWLTVEANPDFFGEMGNDAPMPLSTYAWNDGTGWTILPDNPYPYNNRIGFQLYGDYGIADADSDGIADNVDNCSAVANANQADTDGDARGNMCDNCRLTANNGQPGTGPVQNNADGDAFGNMCDADLNNTNLTTSADYTLLRNALNTANANADLNGSGLVTSADYTLLRSRLNTAPGPGAGP
jgi:hypothetical protein